MSPAADFVVVDLLPATPAMASSLNGAGCVSVSSGTGDAFVFLPQQPNDASGSMVRLDPAAGVSAQALALNNRVQPDVCGFSGNASQGSIEQATVWFDSFPLAQRGLPGLLLTPLNPASGSSRATAINDARLIAGFTEIVPGGVRVAVLWDGNQLNLPPVALQSLAPDLGTEAHGLNAQGMIVGSAQARDPFGNIIQQAVIWDGNSRAIVQVLGTLGSVIPVATTDLNAHATGINDGGTVVGVGDAANPPIRPRGAFFAQAGGNMQLIPVIPAPTVTTAAVAPDGTAAMTISVMDFSQNVPHLVDHGATFHPTFGVIDVNDNPLSGGWVLTDARGVNDVGQICGRGSNATTQEFNRAILLSR